MTKRERRVLHDLWDALSEILEKPENKIQGKDREAAIKAIEKARRLLPEKEIADG